MNFNKHMKDHLERLPLECHICHRQFLMDYDLEFHLAHHRLRCKCMHKLSLPTCKCECVYIWECSTCILSSCFTKRGCCCC